jgi:hypothetical protein
MNTATFDYPMSQLTSTDTILWSDLFHHIANGVEREQIDQIVGELEKDYHTWLSSSLQQTSVILEEMPEQWHVSTAVVKEKLNQLFDSDWTTGVWKNYMECLKENL